METLLIAIIASVSGLIGVIVGGLLNYFISNSQFKREKIWQMNLLVKDKLEEIAMTIEEINYEYKKYMGDLLMYVEFNKNFSIKERPPIPTAKLTMLIDFYSPDLSNYLDSLNVEISSYATTIAKAITGNYQCEKKVFLSNLLDGQTKVEKACKALVKAAAESARKRLA